MIDNRLLLYLLAGTITLIISVRAFVIFFRRRSKYNLATIIVMAIVLIGIILGYFYPGKLDPIFTNVGTTVRILLVVIFVFLLYTFLFYPEIKGFLSRRKIKNK
jgi:hypothetical protein